MQSFGGVRGVEQRGAAFELRGDSGVLVVEFCGANIVRLRLRLDGDAPPGHRVARLRRDDSLALDVAQQADTWSISSGELFLNIALDPLRLEFGDGERVRLRSAPGVFGWECVDDGRMRVQARFVRSFEEHYYGLGQAGPGLDKDGTARRLWNSHYGHGPGTDMAVPLLISSQGYGLFFDNSWDADISIGRSEQRATLQYTAEGGELDCYVLFGASPREALAQYAQLTGFPPMPPAWSLGYIQSTRHFRDAQEIRDLARTLREKRIPCDALVFLSTYGDDMGMNNGVGTLEFHPVLWADSQRLLDDLKQDHFAVVSHEYPVISPKSPGFAEARDGGYTLDYVGSESSVMFNEGQRFLDFSNPEVGAWWWSRHQPLIDSGVDGWWLDGGEGPPAHVQLPGGPGAGLHNVFDLFRQQAFVEGEARSRPERRPFLLCRSGYAGMHALGSATWSGDISNTFDVFEAQLPLGLSTALSGVPYWGTDIGGFFHTVPESPELFVRWFQFATFCPVFRSHGRGAGYDGWREHLPWAHGVDIEQICRTFAELRYQLFAYNYSLAWQAHTRGTPLMRPLVLEFPDDPNVVHMHAEYMWGPSFLVAPVTRGGARHWPVYLPEGTWYDFWTHARFDGEQWIEVAAPLEGMPLFVRGGAIVPMVPVMQHFVPYAGGLTVRVYPAGTSHFELYEDDGLTRAYERGGYALTAFECSVADSAVRLSFSRTGSYDGMPGDREVIGEAVSAAGRVVRASAMLSEGELWLRF